MNPQLYEKQKAVFSQPQPRAQEAMDTPRSVVDEQSNPANLTQIEIPVLAGIFNLADGHAYRSWSSTESDVIGRTSEMLGQSDRRRLIEMTEDYLDAYFTLARQSFDRAAGHYLMCTSASMGLEMIANHLRLEKKRVALIEPCFDNVADIFKRHKVPLHPVADRHYVDGDLPQLLSRLDCDAVCLVTPNNPTGSLLSEKNLLEVASYCERKGIILILDASFRFFTPDREVYDQYRILTESGCDFVVVEDTGKTWPTAELKGAFVSVSPKLWPSLYRIYTDFLLHVSPFTVALLTEFIKISLGDGLATVRNVVNANYRALSAAVADSSLIVRSPDYCSVAWLELKEGRASELVEALRDKEIYVLPGEHFFWSCHEKGSQFVRIALNRDPEIFRRAAEQIASVTVAFRDRGTGAKKIGNPGEREMPRPAIPELYPA